MLKKLSVKVVTMFLLLFLILGAFYWFQVRPAQIKHDCSWMKKTKPAIPYRPAMTEEELKEKGMIKACPTPKLVDLSGCDTQNSGAIRALFCDLPPETVVNKFDIGTCERDNKNAISKYTKEQKSISPKDYWEKATKDEYTFCLHDKGL